MFYRTFVFFSFKGTLKIEAGSNLIRMEQCSRLLLHARVPSTAFQVSQPPPSLSQPCPYHSPKSTACSHHPAPPPGTPLLEAHPTRKPSYPQESPLLYPRSPQATPSMHPGPSTVGGLLAVLPPASKEPDSIFESCTRGSCPGTGSMPQGGCHTFLFNRSPPGPEPTSTRLHLQSIPACVHSYQSA